MHVYTSAYMQIDDIYMRRGRLFVNILKFLNKQYLVQIILGSCLQLEYQRFYGFKSIKD